MVRSSGRTESTESIVDVVAVAVTGAPSSVPVRTVGQPSDVATHRDVRHSDFNLPTGEPPVCAGTAAVASWRFAARRPGRTDGPRRGAPPAPVGGPAPHRGDGPRRVRPTAGRPVPAPPPDPGPSLPRRRGSAPPRDCR